MTYRVQIAIERAIKIQHTLKKMNCQVPSIWFEKHKDIGTNNIHKAKENTRKRRDVLNLN